MENSLLRLSRAYEKGSINKETYRRRRAELIDAVLQQEESDRTITNTSYQKERGGTPDLQPPAAESAATPASRKLVPIAIGGVAVLLVVYFLISGDAESPEERNVKPAKPVDLAPVEVLKSYTEEILRDGELSFDETDKFVGLWTYAPQAEQARWKIYTKSLIEEAQAAGNNQIIDDLDSLYFHLDLEMPGRPEVEEQLVSTPAAGQSPDVSVTETQSDTVTAPTPTPTPVTKKPEITPVQVAEKTPDPVPVAEVADSKTGPDAATKPVPTDKTPQAATTERVALQQPVVPVPEPVPSGSAAAEKTTPPKVVAEADQAPVKEPVKQVAVVTEPKPELPQINLLEFFAPIRSSELQFEVLSPFLQAWRKASPSDRTRFLSASNPENVSAVYASATSELGRYSGELTRDNRHEALRRVSRILGAVIKKQQEMTNPPLSKPLSVNQLRQRNAEHYTLQLFVSGSEDRVQQLINEHSALDLYYVQVVQDGSARYILLEGDYPSKEFADARKVNLPQVGDNKPWTRTNGNLLEIVN